jgi:hypothetical protein
MTISKLALLRQRWRRRQAPRHFLDDPVAPQQTVAPYLEHYRRPRRAVVARPALPRAGAALPRVDYRKFGRFKTHSDII